MSQEEREEVDEEVDEYCESVVEQIKQLRDEARALVQSDATDEGRHMHVHREAVVLFLWEAMGIVSGSVETMRRARRKVEKEKKDRELAMAPISATSLSNAGRAGVGGARAASLTMAPPIVLEHGDGEMSEEQMLAEENKMLESIVHDRVDVVRQAEERAMEISRLNALIANEVAGQADQLDHVLDSAFSTSENVQSGNEQLVKASQHGVGFRIVALLLMLFASACLLFLHWYSS